ncbi:MAG: hypothetical protein LC769_01630 [Chloroflexi bacterium]|nr:hypothetical protein [Chloroflexota bacterium]
MVMEDTRVVPPGDSTPAPLNAVAAGLERLASLGDIHDDVDGLVADILALLADTLDVGLTFLARVTGETLRVEHVRDRAAMGLTAGAEAPLCDTY